MATIAPESAALKALQQNLALLDKGVPTFLLLTGRDGAGKSTLMRQMYQLAINLRWISVVFLECNDFTGHHTIIQAALDQLTVQKPTTINGAIPDNRQLSIHDWGIRDSVNALLGCTSDWKTVLMFDDIDELDEMTVATLVTLVKHPSFRNIMVVASTSAFPTTTEETTLRTLKSELGRELRYSDIQLKGWSSTQIRQYLYRNSLPVSNEAINELQHMTRGYPMFVVHYLETWRADGRLDFNVDAIPNEIRRHICRLLRRIPPSVRQVGRFAACLSDRDFSIAVVGEEMQRSPDEIEKACEHFVRSGLMNEVGSITGRGDFEFSLPIYQRYLADH